MTLQKEICKKCIIEYSGSWTESNEIDWRESHAIRCPVIRLRDLSKEMKRGGRIDWPPKKCLYRLEYIILGQKYVT